MCTRLTLTADATALQAAFPQFELPAAWQPRYNIAPGQPLLVVPNTPQRQGTFFVWGLIPAWAKPDARGRYRSFVNARAETAAHKPAFRGPMRYRRCLVLADGFYEWHGPKGRRQPWRFTLRDGRPFALAGLWDRHLTPDGSELLTCAVLTTAANEVVRPIHDRMPVILPPEAYDLWLQPEPVDPATLTPWLRPYPAEEMRGYPVHPRVNNPRYDRPDAIEPWQPPQAHALPLEAAP